MLRKIWRNPQAVIGLGLIVADLRRCNSRTAFGSPCAGRGESTDEISSAERRLSPWNRSAWAV